MSKIIGDTACPQCKKLGGDKTNNHLILFEDGGAYCNRCEYAENEGTFTKPRADFGTKKSEEELRAEVEEVKSYPILEIPDRKISKAVAERFGVASQLSQVNRDKVTAIHFPSYTHDTGELQGFKTRFCSRKSFGKAGNVRNSAFFGAQQCPRQGRKLFITEGEFDALALYESFLVHTKEEWVDRISIVSLFNGAGAAKREVMLNKELIEGFEEIVCVFDQDAAGREAAEEVKAALSEKIVFYPRFSEKDPSDMWVKGKSRELYFACIQAKAQVKPEKIVRGSEIPITEFLKPLKRGIEVPYPQLMKKLHGFRTGDGGGELTVMCAGTGMGKTTLAREIMYHFNRHHELTLGHIFLEEQRRKTGQSHIAIDNNVPLGLLREDPSCIPYEAFEKSYKELVALDRIYFLDHFGSLASDNLMEYMYYLHHEGCNFIGLDHISMVISGQEGGKNGERKDIDILMTKLAAFTEKTGTSVIAIVHLKRPENGCFNDGKQISLAHLRGSASLEQLAHNIIAIEGDQQGDNPNRRISRVLKNREWGDVGEADVMEYNPDTGRLLAVDPVTFGGKF